MIGVRRPPDRVYQFGRAALNPDRRDPLHLEEPDYMERDDVEKVDKTGIYTLVDGTPVRLKEGDVMPLGAKFRDEGEDPAETSRQRERRMIAEATEDTEATTTAAPVGMAKQPAPENRATRAYPEKE